jgi:hypothetical protein
MVGHGLSAPTVAESSSREERKMPKIEEMYAYIAHEKGDPDDEGLTAFKMPAMGFKPEQWAPMVGADEARMKSLKSMAQQIANTTGQRITLAKFSVRTDIETIEPAVTE